MSMSLCNLILECPVSVAASILSGWIDIQALCRLDTAFCNRRCRTAFVNILSSGQLVHDLSPLPAERYNSMIPLLSWAYRKKVILGTIGVLPLTDRKHLSHYLPTVANALKRLHIYDFEGRKASDFHGIVVDEIDGLNNARRSMTPVINALVLCDLPNLTALRCTNCDTEPPFKKLLQAIQSTLQDIRFNKCSYLTVEHVAGLSMLKARILSLGACKFHTSVATAFTQACPNIVALNLSNCSALTDAAVLSIAHTCTRLQLISLCGQDTITDAAVVELSRCCTALCIVDIGCCTELTDVSVIALAKNCPKLDRLYLKANANYTDAALAAVCEHNHALFDVLNVVACPQITARAVISVLNACTKLTVLYIGTFPSADVVSIIEKCGKLEKLALHGTAVEQQELRAIAAHCHNLIDLGMPNCLYWTGEGDKAELAAVVIHCTKLETLVLAKQCMTGVASTFATRLLQHWRPMLNITTDVGMLNYNIESQLNYFVLHNQM